MEILFFNRRSRKFFESLDRSMRPSVARIFELLEKYGHELGMPHSKALGGGLFELRTVGTIHIRFIYAFHVDTAWILHAFTKKTNQIPLADLYYAKSQQKLLLQ